MLRGIPRALAWFMIPFALGLWLAALSTPPAEAFPKGGAEGVVEDDSIPFKYNVGQEFTAGEKSQIDTYGAHDWELLLDSNGNPLVYNGEVQSAYQVAVRFATMTQAGVTYWDANGLPYLIKINTDQREGQAYFDDLDMTATHEFGHAHGLGHTGRYDSHGDDPPIMACGLGLSPDQGNPKQDDASQLTYLFNTEYDYLRTVTANPSFEMGGSRLYWYLSSGTLRRQGVGSEGSFFVELPSYGSYAYQTTRFVDGDSASSIVDVRVNYRRDDGAAGNLYVQLLAAENDYPNSIPEGWCWPRIPEPRNGDDPEFRTHGTLILRRYKYCTPSLTWEFCTTSAWTMPLAWISGDLRVQVTNYLQEGGGDASLYVDNTRVRAGYDL